jgi:hypothetical protein
VNDKRLSAAFRPLQDAQRLQVVRAEQSWVERFSPPEHDAEFVVNFGCGVRYTPHLMLETVGVLTALDVDFAAVAGPGWCCGQPYIEVGRLASGRNMATNSARRMAAYRPTRTVHWCGAWWPQLDSAFPNGDAPFGIEHITAFMTGRLRERAGQIPWQVEIGADVLVHLKSRDLIDYTDRASPMAAIEAAVPAAVEMIPGMRVVGDAPTPARGAPCTMTDDGRSILDELDPAEMAAVRGELAAATRAAGARMIVTSHQACDREWGKYAGPDLPIRHYISLLAEALGVSRPDRFHEYWRLADPESVVERARPAWESWGLTAPEALRIALSLFPAR